MFRYLPPVLPHMLRMWNLGPWCPAVSSGTEELIRLPLTSQTRGVDSLTDLALSKDTQIYALASYRVLMSESLIYQRLTPLIIVQSLLSTLKCMKKLWRKNLKKEDTLALSRGLNLKHLLDLSNPRPSPLLPNQASQENTVWYMTSHTHAHQTQIQCHPSTQPSIHITSHAPGEPSPQCASSSIVYQQGPKLPSEMSPRHTGLYPYITINGQVWLCNFKEKTALQQTQTTASASPQRVGPMASLPMQVQTSYEPTALALCPSGWMTTFSSISPNNTSKRTTASATFGLK